MCKATGDFKMPIDLYQVPGSAPCRAVRLAAAAVGVDINLKNVDLMAGEHLKPEFIKMNPQHTVPTLDDNGLYLWESRAIMTYLVNQYGKDDSLYPKDPKKRALVDQRLYFDLGTLYQSYADYYYPLVFSGVTPEQAKFDKINNALSFLDKFLEGENYVAGKTLTLADLTLVVTISNFKLIDHDLSKYSNILRWFARIQAEAPKYNEIESVGIKAFKDFVDNLRKKK
ncbi:PREDICTED: glutathione S-transferase 1, isoform C-like isoform X1 [Wasmannia auropunctata]|uniref:glutathione S-transferase 1, isoform C-like isoform X1 n=1 Tax=Wasmannia auropunctata TaxID=64793 RepID=UPI0005EE81E2|nr:PREDICTED: glutathione S-transferase 1, isoform C-like isoform X1 [Wasmannia auropunctata]